MLRLNSIADFDLYTNNLLRIAPDLPDALPLRVEYLARVGRHEHAARKLLEWETFGCPWMRSGVGYLLDGARSYASANVGLNTREQGKLGSYVAALLERMLRYLDQDETVATYRNVFRPYFAWIGRYFESLV